MLIEVGLSRWMGQVRSPGIRFQQLQCLNVHTLEPVRWLRFGLVIDDSPVCECRWGGGGRRGEGVAGRAGGCTIRKLSKSDCFDILYVL